MNGREFRDSVFTNFAKVGRTLGNATRLEILEVLSQGERSVDQLAAELNATVGSTSRNLQVLAAAGLVGRRVKGTLRIYSLADISVLVLYKALVKAAETTIAEIPVASNVFFNQEKQANPVSLRQLCNAQTQHHNLTLLDVRSCREYGAGHLPNAVNIPLSLLADKVVELPKRIPTVVYGRGRYCVKTTQAVRLLRENGFEANRLDADYTDWVLREHDKKRGKHNAPTFLHRN